MATTDGDPDDGTEPIADTVDRDDDASLEGYECSECGEAFETAALLGGHRWNAHKIRGKSKDKKAGRGPGRPRADGSPNRVASRETGTQASRRRLVKESILEILDTTDELRGRSLEPLADLADVIRRDADAMAAFLASLAEKPPFKLLGTIIDTTLGAGGPLSALRAFGPTIRQFLKRAGESRARQAAFNADVAEMVARDIPYDEAVAHVQAQWAQAGT